jgi:Queuosine salvage protein
MNRGICTGRARETDRMNPLLSSLCPVWNEPTVVFLDVDRLRRLAEELAGEHLVVPSWREVVFPIEDSETFIDFIGVGNAINFAFTAFDTHESFSVNYRDTTWRGAFAMWACLARAVEARPGILRGSYLAGLSLRDVQEMFASNSVIPMVEDRWRALNEVGTVLERRYGGYFHNLFQSACFTAFGGSGIVDRLLDQFPSFRDDSLHRATGTVLHFAKRAQLMAMMYQGRAMASDKLPRLVDGDDLGPIADYAIPRCLHSLGILKYTPDLERAIRSRRIIEKDSLQEQEIRAQAVHAQLVLLRELEARSDRDATTLSIDYKLWTLARKAIEPHHLTKTTAY